MRVQQTKNRGRTAFTLVELLVVVAIIAFLAALLVGFLPAVYSQNAESQGAVNLQGWLNIARQKAIRNQNPYGLRLWVKDTTIFTAGGSTAGPLTAPTLFVTDCQYIEQPDDVTSPNSLTGGTIWTSTTNVANDTIHFNNLDLTGGFGPLSDPTLWPIQAGDYFEALGTGLMHQIPPKSLNPPLGIDGTNQLVILATGTPFPIGPAAPTLPPGTTSFRIMRQARVIGTETLGLPTGVYVDLNANVNSNINPTLAPQFVNPLPIVRDYAIGAPPPAPPVGYHVDVLFGPSGSVITPGVTQTTMNLWVRQPDLSAAPGASPANIFSGSPTIIAVFAQTGLVGAYPPIATNANPYFDIK